MPRLARLGQVVGGLFAGFLYGAVIGVVLIAVEGRGRKQQIPFGPFLAAGAMTFVLFGDRSSTGAAPRSLSRKSPIGPHPQRRREVRRNLRIVLQR